MIEIQGNWTENIRLSVIIDGKDVNFNFIGNKILIDHQYDFGIHLLSITVYRGKLQVTDFRVNNATIREFLYLSWTERRGQKKQPVTEIVALETWKIPFSNPLSLLISLGLKKFDLMDMGTNLYKKYRIYYPESIEISENLPNVIKDFYKHNFDFTVINKTENLYGNSDVPYFKINFEFDEKEIFNELEKNLPYLKNNESKLPEYLHYSNLKDDDNYLNKKWLTVTLVNYPESQFLLDKNLLPNLWQFFCNLKEQLKIKIFHGGYIARLPPGGSYSGLHIDSIPAIVQRGCSQLYFPINALKGNSFKLSGVGCLPLNTPLVVNIGNYAHTVLNESNEARWALGLFAELSESELYKIINED